jgi:outer membrane receptor for monomeric catechols
LTTYEYHEGFLKGFFIGGGARYIDKSIIGNPAITDASGTVIGLDIAHPYYSGGYVSVDAWVGYKTKIYKGKYELIVQLNIRDLQEGGSYRPIVANSDGTHSVFRIVQPRTFYLTTSLDF